MINTTNYAFRITLPVSYEEAINKITIALKNEGFGILTEIDVKNTLKKKLDVDFQRYIILGACNPHLAHQALSRELDIGLMLPCNVVVYEEDAGTTVAVVDPQAMLGVGTTADLSDVAEQARAKLKRAIENIA